MGTPRPAARRALQSSTGSPAAQSTAHTAFFGPCARLTVASCIERHVVSASLVQT
jgi:hypothetical protein